MFLVLSAIAAACAGVSPPPLVAVLHDEEPTALSIAFLRGIPKSCSALNKKLSIISWYIVRASAGLISPLVLSGNSLLISVVSDSLAVSYTHLTLPTKRIV